MSSLAPKLLGFKDVVRWFQIFWCAVSFCAAISTAGFSQEASLRTGSRRVVILPDIHADLNTLESVLLTERLINEQGSWVGGDTVLLFLGDLIDKGDESRGVMDLVMRLESEAPRTGGYVEALLGNHESMVSAGDLRYVTPKDAKSFLDFQRDSTPGVLLAYSEDSPYAKWIRSRRSAIRLIPDKSPSYLLVHAGVDRWLDEFSLEETNSLIQGWLTYYHGRGTMPQRSTSWILYEQGPLFSRRMADPSNSENILGPLSRSALRQHLDRLEVDAVIVGHTPTYYYRDNGGVVLQTEAFYRDFIMADTGFSRFMDGRPSALIIEDGKLEVKYYPRPTKTLPLTLEAQRKCSELIRKWGKKK